MAKRLAQANQRFEMLEGISKPTQPMKKDVCCVNVVTVEDYLKTLMPVLPYDKFFEGIAGNEEYLVVDERTGKLIPVTQDFMLNPENWISNDCLNKFYSKVVEVLGDPDAIYKAGRNIFRSRASARFVLMRLVDSRVIFNRLPKENAKFNRNKRVEVVKNDKGYATIRLHWDHDPTITKYSCDMNRGVYEGIGTMTGHLATIEQRTCQFKGGDYCEFHMKYRAKPFFSRLMDVVRLWFSREIVEELESKIEDITNIRINQDRIIEARTKELRETQARLLETEKRSLEHRITGGFAHEMRNALAGAQLEVRTILNYRDKGKLSSEVLKDSVTSLLCNITLLHEKHGIPREEVAKLLIPEIRTIAEIADHLTQTISGVAKDIDRGLSITNQIREYAKLSQLKPGDTPIEVVPLLKDFAHRYRQDFERIGIRYSVGGLESAVVKAEEIHLDSIFTNLVRNARDALEEQRAESRQLRAESGEQGAEGKEIRVKIDEGEGVLLIQVQDNGPGIPEEHLHEIFEPFFSTKPSTGTGLGLGIVRRLVQLYGGKVEVETQAGKGTTFSVSLPVQREL